uniref:(northern house mosquito) hypothetical protein n=1 Tax=Culex pipiens TaxID=7175 RepID=A0A8D8CT80_CULPI
MWELLGEDLLSKDSVPLLLQVLSQQQQLLTVLVQAATQLADHELVHDRAFTEDAPRFGDQPGEEAAESDQAPEFQQPRVQASVHPDGPERKHTHRYSGQTSTTNLHHLVLPPIIIDKMADLKHVNLTVIDPLQPSSTTITSTPGITSAPASTQLVDNNDGHLCGSCQIDDSLVAGHAQVQHGCYPRQALQRPGEHVTADIVPFRYVSLAKRKTPPGPVLQIKQDVQSGRPTSWSGHRNPHYNGFAECSIIKHSSSSTGGEALRQSINAFLLFNFSTSGRRAALINSPAELQLIGRQHVIDGGSFLTVRRCTVWPWDPGQPKVRSGQLVCISWLLIASPGLGIDDPAQQQQQPANSTRRSCV